MKKMAADPTAAIAYATLLGAQTLLAGMLFWIMVPIFAQMIARLGETLEIDASTVVIVLGVAALLQCCYWIRFFWIPVPARFQNVLAAHVLMFASRVSFFFGGALFSAVFFRHVPSLAVFPPVAELLIKVVCLFGGLFALFCYSLELERLARSIAGPHRHQ